VKEKGIRQSRPGIGNFDGGWGPQITHLEEQQLPPTFWNFIFVELQEIRCKTSRFLTPPHGKMSIFAQN
jgi:hypothetical protein